MFYHQYCSVLLQSAANTKICLSTQFILDFWQDGKFFPFLRQNQCGFRSPVHYSSSKSQSTLKMAKMDKFGT